jgi:hypothetical protein
MRIKLLVAVALLSLCTGALVQAEDDDWKGFGEVHRGLSEAEKDLEDIIGDQYDQTNEKENHVGLEESDNNQKTDRVEPLPNIALKDPKTSPQTLHQRQSNKIEMHHDAFVRSFPDFQSPREVNAKEHEIVALLKSLDQADQQTILHHWIRHKTLGTIIWPIVIFLATTTCWISICCLVSRYRKKRQTQANIPPNDMELQNATQNQGTGEHRNIVRQPTNLLGDNQSINASLLN